MGFKIQSDLDGLPDDVRSMAREMAREAIEETILKAVGRDGLSQLRITFDESDPDSLVVSIEGPDELKAKADEALSQD